jgi:hypothetical protein
MKALQLHVNYVADVVLPACADTHIGLAASAPQADEPFGAGLLGMSFGVSCWPNTRKRKQGYKVLLKNVVV